KTPAAPDDLNPAVVFEKRPIYGDWRLISLEFQATARKTRGLRPTYVRRSDFETQRNAEIGHFTELSSFTKR
ncbi:MAG: hypothetical protein LJE63_08735, partial [Desulfobacteraceae bacterium]|nr:hypothetical protein [Desulfobacteraceae bacterium]